MSLQLASITWPSNAFGLSANAMSCVLSTCLATLGDDTTMAEIWPSLRCMRGPCLFDKSRRTRCGTVPAVWSKLPMRGSLYGPGGSFVIIVMLLGFLNSCSNLNKKKDRRMREEMMVIGD